MPLTAEYWLVIAQSTREPGINLSTEGPFDTEAEAFGHACELQEPGSGYVYHETIHVVRRGLDHPIAEVLRWDDEIERQNRWQAQVDRDWQNMTRGARE